MERVVERDSPRALAKRRQILAATQKLFLSQGFESTTMDQITSTAGVSKRTLYKYYPSKESLLGEMVHVMSVGQTNGPPVPLRSAVIENRDDLELALFKIASAIVANHRNPEYFNLLRVVIAEGPRFPDLVDQFAKSVVQPGMAYLAMIIDDARKRGVVTTAETAAVTRLFMGSILVSSYENAFFTTGEPHWLTEDEVRAQVKLLVSAIAEARSAPGGPVSSTGVLSPE